MGHTAHVLDQDWTAYGTCGREQPDALFVSGAAQRQARILCAECPVRVECLVDALDHRVPFGVWGGMTERERRALLRARPEVESWREVVEQEPDLVAPLVRRGRAVRRLSMEPTTKPDAVPADDAAPAPGAVDGSVTRRPATRSAVCPEVLPVVSG
ncbi:MAG: WhiB family transcriptional regulator [Actinotalea sp.]|nr:WhiB family transcriptional regulator [Actinotalea sp.]